MIITHGRSLVSRKSINDFLREQFVVRDYPSFHFINLIGWIVLIAADSLVVSPKEVFRNYFSFSNNTLQWASGYLITIYMRSLYLKYRYRTKSIQNTILYLLIISTLASILFYITAHLIGLLFNYTLIDRYLENIFVLTYFATRMTQILPLMTTWSLLYFGIKFWMDLSAEKERAEKASLLAQSAQLQMLRFQVNPHFLFNSFSSLRALIRSDKFKAEEMIGKLSDFYRYTLTVKSESEIPLIKEVEAISNYAEIEKIRFEEKIILEFSIEPAAEEFPIPSFIIHPLVENAIKYGMKTSEMPLKIKILAKVEKKGLSVSVLNSGKWINADTNSNYYGTGTGLSNIKRRLEFSYPGKHKFEISEKDGFVIVKFDIYRE